MSEPTGMTASPEPPDHIPVPLGRREDARGDSDSDRGSLSLRGIGRSFPGVRALDGVDLELDAGECHGLLGQNGAGKSTLVKIISGADTPDAGTMRLDGRPLRFSRPADAQAAGIFTIYQEMSLVANLTVAENVYLSDLPRRRGVIDWGRVRRAARETLGSLGFDIDVDRQVRTIPVAERQAVEIAKAVHHNARVLLLDEPTATLPKPDVEKLFDVLRRLKAAHVSVLYISHRMEEVYEICDRLTVLRDGRRVTTARIEDIGEDDAVRAMVGDHLAGGLVGQHGAGRRRRINRGTGDAGAAPVLEARGISDASLLRDVSLHVQPGEAVAVAGLVGSGQSELAGCLFGSRERTGGQLLVDGRPVDVRSPRGAIHAGIGLVPEDRKTQGLVLDMTLTPNISMANLGRVSRFGLLNGRREQKLAETMIDRLGVLPRRTSHRAGNLSGGNQQKVVFAKWLVAGARLMIFSEPTRGVDVAAKESIYTAIGDFIADGGSALILSSEIDEALMCDRIYVLARGRVAGEFNHDGIDPDRLLALLR
jgi:ABC-type sugar transport system ATPase subunit